MSTDYLTLQNVVICAAFYNMFLAAILFVPMAIVNDIFGTLTGKTAISDSILKFIGMTACFVAHGAVALALYNAAKAKDPYVLEKWMYFAAVEAILAALALIFTDNFLKLSVLVSVTIILLQALQVYAVYAYTQGVFFEREQQKAVAATVAGYIASFWK